MRRFAMLIALAQATAICSAITLTLDNDFIDTYKRRTTISSDFTLSKAHDEPNTIAKDGDMHIAGSCNTVGLPMVAEIMNAARYPDCLKLVSDLDEVNGTTSITGVWRLWFEHPGHSDQVQFGNNVISGHPTNPDHAFEIHPVTKFGSHSLLSSFVPITDGVKEFAYRPAIDAFGQWKGKDCTILPAGETTKIKTPMVGYNYVKFRVAKLPNSTFEVEDGTFMFASIYRPTGQKYKPTDPYRLMRKCRIVLVEGTPPQAALRAAPVGKKLTVIGMPRISLSLVAWRRDSLDPKVRSWSLPFELVIVAMK